MNELTFCYNSDMSAHELPHAKILAFVGMSGAGKSSAVDYLTEKGFPKVYFGGVVYQAMEEAGIERTPESETKFREFIRETEGKDFVVKRIISQFYNLIEAGQHRILADGLYTWTEYKTLRQDFHHELITVAITAPRALRYKRLGNRKERPYNEHESRERDYSEIEHLEKGGPIAIADYTIVNDSDLESLHKQIDILLEEIDFHSL